MTPQRSGMALLPLRARPSARSERIIRPRSALRASIADAMTCVALGQHVAKLGCVRHRQQASGQDEQQEHRRGDQARAVARADGAAGRARHGTGTTRDAGGSPPVCSTVPLSRLTCTWAPLTWLIVDAEQDWPSERRGTPFVFMIGLPPSSLALGLASRSGPRPLPWPLLGAPGLRQPVPDRGPGDRGRSATHHRSPWRSRRGPALVSPPLTHSAFMSGKVMGRSGGAEELLDLLHTGGLG